MIVKSSHCYCCENGSSVQQQRII